MTVDLQKAGMWKRISAGLFDWILTGILVVGFCFLLSWILGYNDYNRTLNEAYDRYEAQYDIVFEVTGEEYERMSAEQRAAYDEAYHALIADSEAVYAYNMVLSLTLVIVSLGILAGVMVMEFIVPLMFKNGQTLGKKIFGIALMRTDGVKINTMQLFVRTVLGKYTIETMIPVLIILMIFFNMIGLLGTLILGAILLVQLILMGVTHTNSLIHDTLAGTVAVDYASQMIFESTEELIAYKKRVHAEMAARQEY